MASPTYSAITFTKRDLTKKVAEKLDVPVSQMLEPVNAVFDSLREMLSQDEPKIRVEIRNFGVLEVKPAKAKPKARNPRTGEVVYVPARRKTRFKPGKLLRAKLKQPLEED
ncbi:HU family DNA-binding protein [Candidatus Neomarinimicrobiota bacterium]